MKTIETGIDLFEQAGLQRIVLSDRERGFFANTDFQSRITEGALRITKYQTESSFVVGAIQEQRTVFPLLYGTAPVTLENETSTFSMLGFDGIGAARVNAFPSREEVGVFLQKQKGKKFRAFDLENEVHIFYDGAFHFHPTYSGFSEPDIEQYDKHRFASLLPKIKGDFFFLPTKESTEGLFFPIYKRGYLGKPMAGLGYLAISGAPYMSTEYQGADYWRLSPVAQAKLFQRCGFEVTYAVLPVMNGMPQFQDMH